MKLLLALPGALLLGLMVPAPANADALSECLALPGRVAATAVTTGNDAVCIGPSDAVVNSDGDDTYFWVEGDTDGLIGDATTDPGYDTLSLADWSAPLIDPLPGMFGPLSIGGLGVEFVPEAVDYTDFNDVVGSPFACDGLMNTNDMEFTTGLGADTVQCMTGNIFTEGGDDTIIGVTLDSEADAGTGNDYVEGDAGADEIILGPGNDSANVLGEGVDIVSGGTGTDTVRASSNDVLTGVERRLSAKTTTTKQPPVQRKPHEFANCTQLNKKFPHGVGKRRAHDKTSGTPVTNFKRSNIWYRKNKGSDRDGDKIACEKA